MAFNKNLLVADTGTGGTKKKTTANVVTDYVAGPSPAKKAEVEKRAAEATQNVPGNNNVEGSGIDKPLVNTNNSKFTASEGTQNAQKEADTYLQNVKNLASVTDIVDQGTWDKINSTFSASNLVNEAFNYTNGLLQQLSTGRTSYTDQINALMGEIQNRDPFEYDVDNDVLFQQYLGSAMQSGKTAMQDTMGQAAALTGGYGSTYATSAANQQYNAYIQDAYNNLPEYYQMALEAYQMEGEEMYNQLAMLNQADQTEYQRLYDSWSANFSNAQNMYNREYGEWQDSVSNAFNSAGLQLQEHGQLYDQAYSAYTAVANDAQTKYQNEYSKWQDEVNTALSYANLSSDNYWKQQNFIEEKRMNDASLEQKQKQMEMESEQFVALNDVNGDGLVNYEDQVVEEEKASLKTPTEAQMEKALKAYNEGGEDALAKVIGAMIGVDENAIIDYVYENGEYKGTTNWWNPVGRLR